MDLTAIRIRLYARRAALGISQRELARRMGTAQSEISHLESGNYSPTISTLGRWAEALGLRFHMEITDPFDDAKKGEA